MAKNQAIRPNQHMHWLPAAKRKKGPFSPSGTGDVRTDFSLVPRSLSFRHTQISLPVRSFWEMLHFFNLLIFILLIFYFTLFLLIPTADKTNKGLGDMTTGGGLLKVWWCSVVILPPTPFGSPVDVFKGEDGLMAHCGPLARVEHVEHNISFKNTLTL